MKFPYGISDFFQVITENYFYVDRTSDIRLIEQAGKQLLFLRPRRFGKSLWLSTLENYYDIARADEFERLFGHLAIGQNPTPLHNRYFVLKWDFSMVDPSGDVADVRRSLHNHLNSRIHDFSKRYGDFLSGEIEIDRRDAFFSFESVLTAVRPTVYRLYLMIDEYDNFANEVMTASQDRYYALLSGEGLLKTVFKAVKGSAAGRGIDRVFITGVSPVALSDITSGYNVAENIYLLPQFNDLCGFTQKEVAQVLHRVARECGFSETKANEALTMIRAFYDGYRFSHRAEERVYNPTLVLYFMKALQRERQYPRKMLDFNLSMDRAKLAYVSRLPNGGQVILDALGGQYLPRVQELSDRFGVKEMLNIGEDVDLIASLLYYLGVLTLGDETEFGELTLKIPNLIVRRLYAEQMREMLLPDHKKGQQIAQTLYQTGKMQPLCDFVEQRYFPVFDNRDYRWANELTIKTAFLTLLFNDILYIMDSEPALEREYADLIMIVRPDMRQYRLLDILIEFKYLKLKDELGISKAEARAMSRKDLEALPQVREKMTQARTKLAGYRQALQARYKDTLRLRVYAVTAIGFERLVWQEVT